MSVFSEVRQSLTSAQQQYSQWSMLLDSEVDAEKVQSIGSELRNLIKSIEWDLEDLDQTISILTHAVPYSFFLLSLSPITKLVTYVVCS